MKSISFLCCLSMIVQIMQAADKESVEPPIQQKLSTQPVKESAPKESNTQSGNSEKKEESTSDPKKESTGDEGTTKDTNSDKETKKEQESKDKKEEESKKEDKKEDEDTEIEIEMPKVLGNWGGWRDYYRCRGWTVEALLYLDEVWNLHGGRRPTPFYGAPAYTFFLSTTLDTERLWRHHGGTLHGTFCSHRGVQTSIQYVGSFMLINDYEAPPFDELYALWYKQYSCDETFWLLIGKSDAYEYFTRNELVELFSNAGYTSFSNIPFFPTYPNTAMSIVGSILGENLTFTAGIYDGSLAKGVRTGTGGIFGNFFSGLNKNAFLIAQIDWTWKLCCLWPGCLELGAWKHTGRFTKFNGRRKNGTEGGYIVFTQHLFYHHYGCFIRSMGVFGMFSCGDPAHVAAPYYTAVGAIWKGYIWHRPFDTIGLAMGRVDFTRAREAGYHKGFEASYEIFYNWVYGPGKAFKMDYQYVVHPGGRNLPNASVLNLRLFFDF